MKVMLNPAIHNTLNFKAVLKSSEPKFNSAQEKVAENIIDELRTPKPEFGGITAEDYYKRENNLDFLIQSGGSLSQNSVNLLGTRANKNENGDFTYTLHDSFSIGTYNRQNTEAGNNNILHDITIANEKVAKASQNKVWGYLALAVVLYGSIFAIYGTKKPMPKNNNLIENVDTLVKKADTITADTAKFIGHIGK